MVSFITIMSPAYAVTNWHLSELTLLLQALFPLQDWSVTLHSFQTV